MLLITSLFVFAHRFDNSTMPACANFRGSHLINRNVLQRLSRTLECFRDLNHFLDGWFIDIHGELNGLGSWLRDIRSFTERSETCLLIKWFVYWNIHCADWLFCFLDFCCCLFLSFSSLCIFLFTNISASVDMLVFSQGNNSLTLDSGTMEIGWNVGVGLRSCCIYDEFWILWWIHVNKSGNSW